MIAFVSGHTLDGVCPTLDVIPPSLVVHAGDNAGVAASRWAARHGVGVFVRPLIRRWQREPFALARRHHLIACLTDPRPDVVVATDGAFADAIASHATTLQIPLILPLILLSPSSKP